jgi:cytochrome c oxidase subunit 2|tara:strand:+ start:1539 stop:2387 length:849 start_codon:yes stop_codon:yes gene_type:complete
MIEFFGKLGEHLGFPINASEHGLIIDHMNGWIHWLMLILFIGWGIFFIYTLYKFGLNNKNEKADYEGVKSHYSTYAEYGVILFEVFLLIAFAMPVWSMVKTNLPDIDNDTIEIRVIAQQFAWNIHYPGADGKFGKTNIDLVDEESNPVGLDRESVNGADDIVKVNQMHIPVNKDIMIYLSSKDVIHSFSLPEMRVKQDAIPGLTIPVFFRANLTSDDFLKKIVGTKRDELDQKGYEIACAQLCGNSHYRMKGYMTVETMEEYESWLEEQAEYLEAEDDDDDW